MEGRPVDRKRYRRQPLPSQPSLECSAQKRYFPWLRKLLIPHIQCS